MNRIKSTESPDLVRLLKDLIEIPSLTGEEKEIGGYLVDLLQGLGLQVTRQVLERDRFNVLARTEEPTRVVLCTHMDTVAPYKPFMKSGGTVFGRGACDAKGSMASMIGAARRLLRKGEFRFGLLFVAGEETDSLGARKAADLCLESEYVVVGEPTDNILGIGQKGVLMFRVDVAGKAGHSAIPSKGDSAVHRLAKLITRWNQMDWGGSPEFGESTLNIGLINGGTGPNVVAGLASAQGVLRVGSSCQTVEKQLREFENEQISIETISSTEPTRFHTVPGFESKMVAFGSDAPHLRSLGKVCLLGPGSIEYAHSEDEQVSIDQLVDAVDLYCCLVSRLNRKS
jgi:acetylornithine deacetylase